MTPQQLEKLDLAGLIPLRDDIKIKMARIQGQLTQWNNDVRTGDDTWAKRARGAMSWLQKELMMVNLEIKRRSETRSDDLPTNKSQAFAIIAKELLTPELRKQIWTIAEKRYPYLFPNLWLVSFLSSFIDS